MWSILLLYVWFACSIVYSAGSSGASSSNNATVHDVWKKQPSPGVLTKVAKLFAKRFDCSQLASQLKLGGSFLEQVDESELTDFHMLAKKVLNAWMAEKSGAATCEVLHRALLDIGRKDMADKLEDILAERSQ